MAGLKLRGNVRVSSVKMKCDVGCGMWEVYGSVECGVRSVICKVWGVGSVECEAWSAECEVRSMESDWSCVMWEVWCKVRRVRCGV